MDVTRIRTLLLSVLAGGLSVLLMAATVLADSGGGPAPH